MNVVGSALSLEDSVTKALLQTQVGGGEGGGQVEEGGKGGGTRRKRLVGGHGTMGDQVSDVKGNRSWEEGIVDGRRGMET